MQLPSFRGHGSRLRDAGRAIGLALVLFSFSALAAESARAVSFTLDVEFDQGLQGAYADVEVVQDGNGLFFEIALLGALGPNADLHELYFNLVSPVPELMLESDDVVTTAYVLDESPTVLGGAGSSFDWGVSFGNGAGPSGNGVLQSATFRIAPVDPQETLSLSAFLDADPSFASGGTIPAMMAAHVQGTALVNGATSETVGGTVPEPSTGMLVTGGLVAALAGRRRSQD